MSSQKTIRRSQTLTPFGVGAIFDILGESFVAADTRHWKGGDWIKEPRLEAALGVQQFRLAPAMPDGYSGDAAPYGVPFARFPRWLFCPHCRRMFWHTSSKDDKAPECHNSVCGRTRLVPMRWVMTCPKGHLADVPWSDWAHSSRGQAPRPCDDPIHHLRFETQADGGSLASVFVRCHAPGCGRKRSLADLMDSREVKNLPIRCPGIQPWEAPRPSKSCDAVPVILQRGATNLTFHITESSIDIPPWSDFDYFSDDRLAVVSHPLFDPFKGEATHSDEIISFVASSIATAIGLDRDDVIRIIKAELAKNSGNPGNSPDIKLRPVDRPILLEEEYEAFLKPDKINDPRDRFQKRLVDFQEVSAVQPGPYGEVVESLFCRIGSLVKVLKLREVRALRGFSRLGPPEGMESEDDVPGRFEIYGSPEKIAPHLVSPSLNHMSDWLPALEVYGEGIFLILDETRLREWEVLPEVKSRMQTLEKRFNPSVHPALANTRADARTVLLHTLSHLLIRQLSFECGYAIASLRERIYSEPANANLPMAGVLIYTAAGDAEGTLGGLVREANADRFASTTLKALQLAEWCSSDPLCRESQGQGLGNLNLAACHACALLPETSCTVGNRLLDRTLVTGVPGQRTVGFLGDLVDASLFALTEAGA